MSIFNMVGCGGGSSLNYEVVGGTSAPSSPSENTIWINTSTTITSHIFSATEPENPSKGIVWISTGNSSQVAFSATEENPVMIYPLSAKQYVSGAWVDVTAKSWQGGKFVEWFTYFYNRGDQCTDITGGWNAAKNTNATATFNTSSISFGYSTASNTQLIVHTKNKVDVTKLKKITALIDVTVSGGYANELCIGLYNNTPTYSATPTAYAGTTNTGTDILLELNVESYTGSYYIGFKSVGSKGTIYEVKEA